jgi:hypothetical protein
MLIVLCFWFPFRGFNLSFFFFAVLTHRLHMVELRNEVTIYSYVSVCLIERSIKQIIFNLVLGMEMHLEHVASSIL